MFRRSVLPLLLVPTLVALATSCGSDSADDATFASIPPATASPSLTPTVVTTDSAGTSTTVEDLPTTTAAPETSTTAAPTTVVPEGVVGLSADGPWKLVDGAPGVESPGLVYELMPKLWAFLPTEESDDDGTLFVPSPEDIPVIEAYLGAVRQYNEAASVSPMALESAGWDEWYLDGGSSFIDSLEERDAQSQVLDLDAGVVRRPHVLGDERSDVSAIIFDCVLDGSVFRMPDGSLAPGSAPGVAPVGISARLTLDNARWIVVTISNQPEACGASR